MGMVNDLKYREEGILIVGTMIKGGQCESCRAAFSHAGLLLLLSDASRKNNLEICGPINILAEAVAAAIRVMKEDNNRTEEFLTVLRELFGEAGRYGSNGSTSTTC